VALKRIVVNDAIQIVALHEHALNQRLVLQGNYGTRTRTLLPLKLSNTDTDSVTSKIIEHGHGLCYL